MSDTQRLPNLYQLLGLNGLENNPQKINAAIQRAQAKLEILQGDAGRAVDAQRLHKVVALGQKYLLGSELKANYDAQWTAIFAPELTWDMASLDALLPAADPHAPFAMAEYLRTSQVRDPLAAEADLRKLITLLGGEWMPTTNSHSDSTTEASTGPITGSIAGLITGQPVNLQPPTAGDQAVEREPALAATSTRIPRSPSTPATTVAFAKRMRQKRQRALLFGGTLLAAGIGGLCLLGVYLSRPSAQAETIARAAGAQDSGPVVVKPDETELAGNAENNTASSPAALPNPIGLIQPGQNVKPLEIQATQLTKPEAMPAPAMPAPAPEPMKPEPAKPEPTKPEPAKPEPTKPEPAKPEPAKPELTKPEPSKPEEPPADVKLTAREKKVWQEDMKRVRAGLSKLDPATSEQQIASLKPLAKTAQQQSQLATLEQAVGLIRKAREALVAGISGLESAQSFMVGNSTEVSFVEGDETRIIVRVSGQRQEYRLEAIPPKMGVTLMKMKPNLVDANLDAAMGAYILVQLKKTNDATNQGKKLLETAVFGGAISKELSLFYADDYKLQ